jgi:hypothetical protein
MRGVSRNKKKSRRQWKIATDEKNNELMLLVVAAKKRLVGMIMVVDRVRSGLLTIHKRRQSKEHACPSWPKKEPKSVDPRKKPALRRKRSERRNDSKSWKRKCIWIL